MKSIILLSGPVGAGKTTVARLLVEISAPPVAYIEGDTFWNFIARDGNKIGRVNNFKIVMSSMMAAALPYARAGYEVIVDFSLPPWFLDTAKKIAAFRNIPLYYVIIKPGKEICAARAAGRAEGVVTDYAAYEELYKDFEGYDEYTISDNDNDAWSIARRIRKDLAAGRYFVNA